MKIYVVGSVKIDSRLRKEYFYKNLDSLKTLGDVFSWNFNIVGRHAKFCSDQVKKYSNVSITNDNDSSYYEIVTKQISSLPPDSMLFFFLEDFWFVCPHKNLFFYLLEEFYNSKADVLRTGHLAELWERENAYNVIVDKPLYKEYSIDFSGLKGLWQKYPNAYVTSMPGIFKKEFTLEIFENNKSLLNSKKPGGFELYGKKAEEFLAKRGFITMVPTFHVFREVFPINQDVRAMDVRKALKIIKLRDAQDPAIKSWRRVVRLIMAPRTLAGRIKRKVKKIIL